MNKDWIRDGYFPQVWEETLTCGDVVFVARHPNLPGVIAQAATADEAVEQWHEMREEVFADFKEWGKPIPEPFAFRIECVVRPAPVPTLPKVVRDGASVITSASIVSSCVVPA